MDARSLRNAVRAGLSPVGRHPLRAPASDVIRSILRRRIPASRTIAKLILTKQPVVPSQPAPLPDAASRSHLDAWLFFWSEHGGFTQGPDPGGVGWRGEGASPTGASRTRWERGKPRTSGWISRGRERSSCTGGALHPQVTQLGKLIPTAPCEPPCQHRNRGSRSGSVNPPAEAVMLPEAPEEDLLRMNSSQFSGSLFRRSPVEALPSLKISAVVHLVPLVLLVWGWPSAFSVVSPAGGWMASPMWKGSRMPRGLWPPASSPVSPSPSGWHSRRELSLGCCRHRPTSCLGSRGGLVDGGKAPPEARGRSEAHCGGRLEPKLRLFRTGRAVWGPAGGGSGGRQGGSGLGRRPAPFWNPSRLSPAPEGGWGTSTWN